MHFQENTISKKRIFIDPIVLSVQWNESAIILGAIELNDGIYIVGTAERVFSLKQARCFGFKMNWLEALFSAGSKEKASKDQG